MTEAGRLCESSLASRLLKNMDIDKQIDKEIEEAKSRLDYEAQIAEDNYRDRDN